MLSWSLRSRRLLSNTPISMDKWAHLFFFVISFLTFKPIICMHVVVVKEANLSTGIGADNQKTMAVAIGRSFSIQPGSLFNNKSLDRGSPAGRLSWLGDGAAATPRYRQTCVGAQQRPTWLPGLDPPPHLDGT